MNIESKLILFQIRNTHENYEEHITFLLNFNFQNLKIIMDLEKIKIYFMISR